MIFKSPPIHDIFNITPSTFIHVANQVFQFQQQQNSVYQQWLQLTQQSTSSAYNTITTLPFLPISCFKTHTVVSASKQPLFYFASSGTTQTETSKHAVIDEQWYTESFIKGFELFYGKPSDYCILALLPNYIEKGNSSLVYMVNKLIQLSKHPNSNFYLYNHQQLSQVLQQLEQQQQKTLLIGVTFALLDFAEQHAMPLQHTIVMETGGMKGRKKEITKMEVHQILQSAFNLSTIHAEYGMTELFSQAYAKQQSKYICPPWMKVLVREEEDPFSVKQSGRGLLNVIDLANVHSCSFIATDDVGIVYEDGSFEVLGRRDHSDLRGCSLMV